MLNIFPMGSVKEWYRSEKNAARDASSAIGSVIFFCSIIVLDKYDASLLGISNLLGKLFVGSLRIFCCNNANLPSSELSLS